MTLLDADRFFQSFAENNPDGVALLESNGRLAFLNPAGIRLLGYANAGEDSRTYADFLTTEHQERFNKEILPCILQQGSWQGELQLRNVATQKAFDLEQTFSILKPQNQIIVLMKDVTDRRKVISNLENLRALVEGSTDFCALFDSQSRLFYANASLRRELGWKAGGGAPRLNELVAPELASLFEDVAWPALRAGQPWNCEAALLDVRNSSLVPTSLRLFSLVGTGGDRDRFALLGSDLREKKAAELMLLHSSKMASLGELSGGIAHEVNSPLMYIIERSKLMRQQLSGPTQPDLKNFSAALERIENMGQRISKTIKSLRSFARNAEQDPFEAVPLRGILNDTLEICSERFRNHNVEVRLQGELDIPTFCRPIQLSQVFLNLMQNSFDAITPLTERWIEVNAILNEEGWIDVQFTDSGPGIPAAIRPHLLDPHFTTKRRGAGTGLGLKISHRIIIEHGGELRLDAEASHTRFIVRLPRAPAEAPALDVA